MALVALLSARDGARDRAAPDRAAALIDFGGQPLVEYQARLAINAGAERIFIHVEAAAPDLAQLVDRLVAGYQRDVALVQDMTSLSRSLMPEDRILLLAENLILPSEALASLLVAGPAGLLALPSVPATSAFERIDSEANWAGALCLPGGSVLATLDMLGDWDLGLTLLRRAVQESVRRVALSPELVMDGRLALIRDQANADIALQALSDNSQATLAERSAGLASLFAPVSRSIVREIVRRQIEPNSLALMALLVAAGAVALAVSAWMIPALVLVLLALGAADLAHQAAIVTLRAPSSPWRNRLVQAAGLLILAILGFHLSAGQLLALSGAWLPLFFIAVLALAEDLSPPAGLWARWLRLTVPSAVILILLGQLLGMAAPAFALLGVLVAIVSAVRLLPISHLRV
jgi:hypothetical protein